MSHSLSAPQTWIQVDPDDLTVDLTSKDRVDLAKFGYPRLVRRLRVQAVAAMLGFLACVATATTIEAFPVLLLAVCGGMLLLAAAALRYGKLRRVITGVAAESVIEFRGSVLLDAPNRGWRRAAQPRSPSVGVSRPTQRRRPDPRTARRGLCAYH